AGMAPVAQVDVAGPDEVPEETETLHDIAAAAPLAALAAESSLSSADAPSDDELANLTEALSHPASSISRGDEAIGAGPAKEKPLTRPISATAKYTPHRQASDAAFAPALAAVPAPASTVTTPAAVHFPTSIRNLTSVSPEHLLRAFPGLDPRAQALRTVGQALLQARHPQLGAAAADPGLLLLLLRRKGILSESLSDAAAAPLLTALLLSEPRFFRIVGAVGTGGTSGAATAAGDLGGGGSSGGMDFAVQLRLDELMALVEPVRGGEPPAVAAAGAAQEGGSESSRNSQQSCLEESATNYVDTAATDIDEVVVKNAVLAASLDTEGLEAVFAADTDETVLDAVLAAVLDVVSCRIATETETAETEKTGIAGDGIGVKTGGGLSEAAVEAEAPSRAPAVIVQDVIGDIVSAFKSDTGGSDLYSSGSGGREAGVEGVDDELSDDAHVAMLLRLLERGARLEEEPLPDSEAKLQRLQLSPLPLDIGDKATASSSAPAAVGTASSQRVDHGVVQSTASGAASGASSSVNLDLVDLEAVEEALLRREPSRDAPLEDEPGPQAGLEPEPKVEPRLPSPPTSPPQVSQPLPPPQPPRQLLPYDTADLDADADADAGQAVAVAESQAVAPVPSTIKEPMAARVPSSPSSAHAAPDTEQLHDETSPGPSNAFTAVTAITTGNTTSSPLSVERLTGALSDIVSSANDAVTAAAELRIAIEQQAKLAVERHAVQPLDEGKELEADAELTHTSSFVIEAAVTECANTSRLLMLGLPTGAEVPVACSGSDGGIAAVAAALTTVDGDGEGVVVSVPHVSVPPFNEPGRAAADGSIIAVTPADGKHDAEVVATVTGGAAGIFSTAATESCACIAGEVPGHGSVNALPAAEAGESQPWQSSTASPSPLLLPVSVTVASTAATTASAPDSAPSAAHLQPAVVRYISALDVEVGEVEVLTALAAMAQHCAAAARVAIDCAVADLQPDVDVPEPTAFSTEALGVVEEPDAGALTGVDLLGESYSLAAATTTSAVAAAAQPTTTSSSGAPAMTDRRYSPILLTVLAPAVAQAWCRTLYVLGVAGVGPENALTRAAVSLLTDAAVAQTELLTPAPPVSGVGCSAVTPAADDIATGNFERRRIVKVLWNAQQVVSALSPLLPPGLQVGPVQDLHVLARLATEDVGSATTTTTPTSGPNMSGAAGPNLPSVRATESRAASLPAAAVSSPSGLSPLSHRPWSGMVPLQERLAELGVPGRDLASLAALRADAWGNHPLSCVVVAAAVKLLCQVLEVRRALLFGDEELLDTLMCGVCSRVAATTE
ncbi:hypothetical protein Vafri_9690, partial [Volvox africanus]